MAETPHEIFLAIARATIETQQFPPLFLRDWRQYRDRILALAREGMAMTHEAGRLSGGTPR